MRLAMLGALVMLAACEPEGQQATGAASKVGVAEAGAAATQCARLTNNSPEKLAEMTPELREMVKRDYDACVEKVTGENVAGAKP